MMNLKSLERTVDKIMNGETVIIRKEHLNDVKDEINCLFGVDIEYKLLNGEYVSKYEVCLSDVE